MGLFYIKKCEISQGNCLRMPNDDNDVPLDGTSFVCKVLGKIKMTLSDQFPRQIKE